MWIRIDVTFQLTVALTQTIAGWYVAAGTHRQPLPLPLPDQVDQVLGDGIFVMTYPPSLDDPKMAELTSALVS